MIGKPGMNVFRDSPLIVARFCVECGRRLGVREGDEWFTCSICGEAVCEGCRKGHIPLCTVKTWGMAEVSPETGELVQSEKPNKFAIG